MASITATADARGPAETQNFIDLARTGTDNYVVRNRPAGIDTAQWKPLLFTHEYTDHGRAGVIRLPSPP